MRILYVESGSLNFNQGIGFYSALDATLEEVKRPKPVMRFKDRISQQWAGVRGLPIRERKVKTNQELLERIGKVVVLFAGWHKDKELEKIIEAAEDLDIPVKVLRSAS